MHCSRCGDPLAPGARFCSSCGTPVDRGSALPAWARAVGIGSAIVVLVVLLVTVVLPSQAEDVAADVVAGDWNCDLDYAGIDITTEWDVVFHEDGRVDIEDQYGETSEGEWTFEDGELAIDFGDADLGNPELSTASSHDASSLDAVDMCFTPSADDEDEGVGQRTLTCERDE
jgi:hypothetical protein